MLLQTGGPPDTSAYYRAAYVWAAVLYAGYSLLLWSRGRRVRAGLTSALQMSDGDGEEPAAGRDG
jgi:hypothetical protein